MTRAWRQRAAMAVVAATLLTPATAAAAPRTGIWEGAKGKGKLHLLVSKRTGGSLEISNWAITCGWAGTGNTGDRYSEHDKAVPIGRHGRLRQVKEYGRHRDGRFTGRLGRRTGRLSAGLSFGEYGDDGKINCSKEFKRVRMRWIAPRPLVRDGIYDVTSSGVANYDKPPRGTLQVWGAGGAIGRPLEGDNTQWGGPQGGVYLGLTWYCDGYSEGSAALSRDGSFAIEDPNTEFSATGRFTSRTTISGTYRNVHGDEFPCDSGELPFTAVRHGSGGPEGPAPGAGGGGGGGGHHPAPPHGCVHEVKLGHVTLRATCLRRKGKRVTTSGAVRVNGLDLRPQGDAEVVADLGQARIESTGKVAVLAGDLTLFEGKIDWSASRAFTFRAGGSARRRTLKGFPVTGEISGSWVPDGATLKVHVSLGAQFGGVTGDADLRLTMAHGLELDKLAVSLSQSDLELLGKLAIRSAGLTYTTAADSWSGNAEVQMPAGKRIAGSLTIQHGRFKSASARADDLNMPLGEALFLQRIGLGVAVDPLKLSGDTAFTGGPRLSVLGHDLSALEGDGSISWENGPAYDTWALGGAFKLASFQLGNASVVYRTGLDVTFGGELGFQLLEAGFTGKVDGWIEGLHRFQAEGSGSISLPLVGSFEARALLSSLGLGACGEKKILFGTVGGGVTYRWGGSPHMFTGGCDFGDVTVPHSAGTSQAGTRAIALPGGRRAALLAIRGRGGAPRVTVTGPKGFAVAGSPAGAALTDRAYLLESPQEATTYVIVDHPAKGTYRVALQPGSVPLARVGRAGLLSDPRIRATVRRGRHHRRVLRWRVRHAAGQRVTFVERGRGLAHTLGTVRGGHGRLRFRPALGTKGRRSVLAIVSYRGVPRAQRRVARFRMGRVHVARPRHVGVRHARHRHLTVRWRHRGGAVSFDVRLALRDGRRLLRVAGPHARHARFRGIGRHARGRMTVIAHGLGRDTARARARVRR